jgi:hypothetical protein
VTPTPAPPPLSMPRAARARRRYRQLDDASIVTTIERLEERIGDRFPNSGLRQLAQEFLAVARETADRVASLQRPNWPIRVAAGLLITAMVGVVVTAVWTLPVPARVEGWAQLVQAVESAINDLVFIGLAMFFLLTVEGRLKRRRALAALHELRSVAHIVDMHQLTKDPEGVGAAPPDPLEPSQQPLSPAELGRYLDYCSELLSLTSKVAALYTDRLHDPVVLAAVNEIEALAGGLSNKIWQKITLLERLAVTETKPG